MTIEKPVRNLLRVLEKTAGSGLCVAVSLAILLFSSPAARAVGFRLPNQDPVGIARGNAFAATADNPSAIYYNPAGITQLEGQSLSAGLYLVSAGDTFEGSSGTTAETKSKFQPVPQLYYVNSPKDLPFSFGFGVYVPYGLSLNWGPDPPFRDAAERASLLYVTANPIIAWKVTPTLSVAVGPTINYSKAKLFQGFDAVQSHEFHFVGDDTDFGFNAGVRWQPCDQWAFGVNYRYLTTLNYQGHSQFSPILPPTSTSASIRFPQYVVGGISFRPTENWNFEVDVDWTDWDNVDQIVFHGTTGGDIVFPLNYQSSFMYEFGVTRKLPKGFFVSAGYFYSENSSPQKYFNPIVPDANLHLFNLGLNHKGRRWDWAASYTFAINPGSQVSGSVFGPTVDGTYRTVNQAINVSATLKF